MTAVLDVDLLADDNPLTPSFQPTLALVWAGDRVLGTTEIPPILPGGAQEARAELLRKFGDQILAASELPAAAGLGSHTAADLTVVVCARDRPRLLHRCLLSLAELDPAPAEVLVVDHGTATDATAQVAEATARLFAAPGVGWAEARNVGWSAARTELVAFVSEDGRAHATYAGAVAGAFLVPEVAAVLGLVAPGELNTRPQRLFEVLPGLNRGYSRQVLGPGSLGSAFRLDRRGTGANMAFRRDVLGELGGFDQLLDQSHDVARREFRSPADLDMLVRILDGGRSLVYEPDAVVRRTSPRDWMTFLGEMADNGSSYARVLAKYEREHAVAAAARKERLRWHRRDHLRGVLAAVARRKPWTAAVLLAELAGSRRGRAASDNIQAGV